MGCPPEMGAAADGPDFSGAACCLEHPRQVLVRVIMRVGSQAAASAAGDGFEYFVAGCPAGFLRFVLGCLVERRPRILLVPDRRVGRDRVEAMGQ